jgi:hypothetical protein
MILLLVLSLMIPIVAGLALTWAFFPPRRLGVETAIFHLSLAAGIGLGVTSCLYFMAMLPAHVGVIGYLDAALAVIGIGTAVFLYQKGLWRREGVLQPEVGPAVRMRPIFPILFGITSISGLVSIAIAFLKEPHGKWDAWVIWNLHARFLLRGGQNWQDYLASGLEWTHPDYPLLLPLSIVRMWKYAGSETVYGPILLSVLFTISVAGLLVFSLAILRGRTQGFLAGLVLMGSPYFLDLGAAQIADIPLAFFILATLVLLLLHDKFCLRQDYPLLLAGLAAALAAWTKNEGLLFFLVVAVAQFAWNFRSGSLQKALGRSAWFMAGALPVLAVIVFFKLKMAPATDIFSGQGLQQMLERLSDAGRYKQIALAYIQTLPTFTQGVVNIREGFRFNPGVPGIALLGLYMILAGIRPQGRERTALLGAFAVLVIMLAGYFGIYAITPQDLRWHLLTSLNRLLIQLWPCAIFLCFMLARTPEQVLGKSSEGQMPASAGPADGQGKKKGAPKQRGRRKS